MLQFIEQGGPFVWVLLALAFIGTVIVLERIVFFQRTKIHVGDLILGLANHIRKGAHNEALREAARAPGSVARVAHSTIMRHYLPRADLRDIAQEAGQLEVPRIEKNLRGLYTIALIAPMVGMMGTINGLIYAFVDISEKGGLSDKLMAKGIYESLITTGLGLLVAVPGYLFYLYFFGRAKRLVHRIERAGIEVVNLICDQREGGAHIAKHGSLNAPKKANAKKAKATKAAKAAKESDSAEVSKPSKEVAK